MYLFCLIYLFIYCDCEFMWKLNLIKFMKDLLVFAIEYHSIRGVDYVSDL
jgi:hypothetical protein